MTATSPSPADDAERPADAAVPRSATSVPGTGRPLLDVVVVHRRQSDLVGETVRRLLDQGNALPPGDRPVPKVRVAVVDNASGADELARLRAAVPSEVTVLARDRNLGFGPGANAGFRWFLDQPVETSAEWLAVCPHDARVLDGCLATALHELGRRPQAGLASADVGDGLTPMVDRYFGAVPGPARVVSGWEPAGYPHGTLLFARRDCLADIGLFDERYFAYVEEADLALRARAAGWQVGVIRGADVRNAHLGSHVGVVDYLQQRNTLLLAREHFGRYALFLRTVMAVSHLVGGLIDPANGRRDPYWTARARVLAIRDYYRGRLGPPPDGAAA